MIQCGLNACTKPVNIINHIDKTKRCDDCTLAVTHNNSSNPHFYSGRGS